MMKRKIRKQSERKPKKNEDEQQQKQNVQKKLLSIFTIGYYDMGLVFFSLVPILHSVCISNGPIALL